MELFSLAFLYEIASYLISDKKDDFFLMDFFSGLNYQGVADFYYVILFFLVFYISIAFRIKVLKLGSGLAHAMGGDVASSLYKSVIKRIGVDVSVAHDSNEITSQIATKALIVAERFINPLLHLFSTSLIFVVIFLYLLFVAWEETLGIALIAGGYYLIVIRLTRSRLFTMGSIANKETTRLVKFTSRVLNSPREFLLYGELKPSVNDFDSCAQKLAEANGKAAFISQLPKLLLEGVLISIAIIYFYYITGSGSYDGASLMILLVAILRLLPLMQQIFFMLSSMKNGESIVASVLETISHGSRFHQHQSLDIPDWHTLSFDSVKYKYSADQSPFLYNIQVHRNSITAIVGPSGVGKSTFVNILLGCSPHNSGRIYFDDFELGSLCHVAWRNKCSVVSQSPTLDLVQKYVVEGTGSRSDFVREIFDENLSHLGFNFGLETVRERIVNHSDFSGGELKRISLAFAYSFSEVKLIALDEFTAGLDAASRELVLDFVTEKSHGKTVIIVTHLESDLRICDQVCSIQKNDVVK
ncbi:ABC-type multidrug transport system, ATPase and permease component [Oceanospirillum sp. MED92]|uniref:ABC-type multidrug transport system, ATPase and permease component n=2 Tax=Neptuniibacter caesariensis TaxID=207954 RepID=A0A7U8C301_NEPCE|nr:ABC-type multidrug transport system, ATPase and permease component [Oceanospirillum sp. MED92] [Neptuniibacter caesariensis]